MARLRALVGPARVATIVMLLLVAACGGRGEGPAPTSPPPALDAALLERLRTGSVKERIDAARALAETPALPVEAAAPLAAALADPERDVRSQAALALATLGPAAAPAVEALTRALCDPDSFVRWRAARALARIGPAARSALPVLEESAASKDETELGRHWAQEAVKAIRGE